MSTMNAKLKRLDKFLRNVVFAKHHTINYGGCCSFAAQLAPYLKQYGTAKIRVVGSDCSLEMIRPLIKRNTVDEWNKHGIDFWHVAIELKCDDNTYHVDASGVHSSRRFKFFVGHLTLTEAKELTRTGRGWNSRFDRKELPHVSWQLKQFFKGGK